jgi:hypothetical protein
VVQQYINELLSKSRKKEADILVAATMKEERGLRLEVDMLNLGAQRLRFIAVQAKLDKNAAESDAAAAEARANEANLNLVEEEIALKATELNAERKLALDKIERTAALQDRALNLKEQGVDLQALKNTRTRFMSSFGNNRKAIEANKKRMTGELSRTYQSVESPAQYLLSLDQTIIDLERTLQGRI